MAAKTEITRDDIMPMEEFGPLRKERRKALVEMKRNRRIEIGPVATVYFESYDTMWWQIHEMLFIEKGGKAQIEDELRAYNPLIPKGAELVCTVMFEIDDPVRRHSFLAKLGGIEETMFFEFDDERVAGVPETDVDRTTADGKASSVQFIHFPFSGTQIEKFRAPKTRVVLGFSHAAYSHMVVMPENVRTALAEDFRGT